MKTKILLTSLIAIGVACAANAETDVTFGGDYTLTDGTTANVATPVADATYTYEKSDGSQSAPVAYDVDPTLTDFTYLDKDGNTADLSTGTPSQSYFTGTSGADNTVVWATNQDIVSGATVVAENYEYLNGAGEQVQLGTTAQDMVQTVNLDATYTSGTSIDVTNGTAASSFDGTIYTVEVGNNLYHLNAAGDKLVDANDIEVEPTPGSVLADHFDAMKTAFITDTGAVTAAETLTASQWTDEQANFATASAVVATDTATVNTLDGYYSTLVTATDLLNDAQGNQTAAGQTQTVNMATQTEAVTLYNSSITETIENGANTAIDDSIAGGAIKTALDTKADVTDVAANTATIADNADNIATNTANIATNTAAIADNTDNIATNTANIAANTAAIADNADNIATNTANIATNTAAIADNTDNIATNTANIAANTAAIADNADNIATNTANIATNTAAIADNADNIATNTTAITAETERATAAEGVLDTRITANADAITAEANRATAAENALRNDFAKAEAATLKSANAYTDQRVSDLEDDMSAGIASTAALSSVAVSGVKRGELSFGGGYGYYNNQSAFALGATMGLTDNWSINAGAGLGMNGDNVAIRAGTNYKIKLY